MAQAHCTTCNAIVTVHNGECLVGHPIPLEAVEAAHVGSSRGRRKSPRRFPSLEALRPPAVPRANRPEGAVSVLRPEAPRTVSPLMEMFGFGETPDPPWEYFDEPEPRAPVTQVLSPIGPLPDAPVRNRPGAEAKNRPSIFDALPRLADLVSASAPDHENTGTLIERLWQATDDFEPIDSWMPKTEYADRLSEKPVLRWIAGGALTIMAILLVAWLVGSVGGSDAPPAAAQAAIAIGAAETSAASVRDAINVLVDPSSSGVGLNEAAVALTEFDTAAREVASAANLLADQHEGVDLASTLLIRASDEGTAIERRLGAALTYRLVFDRAFVLPDLPDRADITAAADVSFELSAMVADTQRALDQLPFEPSLEDHRRLAAQALADIEVLSGMYVEALRAQQAGTAARHSATILELADETRTVLAATLPEVGDEISVQVDAFEATLDEAANALVRWESTGSATAIR